MAWLTRDRSLVAWAGLVAGDQIIDQLTLFQLVRQRVEGQLAGKQFVQDDAEGEQIERLVQSVPIP